RMISAVFRRGGDVTFVVEELKAVFDPRGGAWVDGRYVPSLLAAIGEVIEQHMIDTGFITRNEGRPISEALQKVAGDTDDPRRASCPRCGDRSLIRQEGCDNCTECVYSRCG
ncbi:MAG: ribonucleoside-diphosphate reductase, adenosylcobalamin-dependent, partial [Nitratireductor sp.]